MPGMIHVYVCVLIRTYVCVYIYTYPHTYHKERVKVTIILIYQMLGQFDTNHVCVHLTESLKHNH